MTTKLPNLWAQRFMTYPFTTVEGNAERIRQALQEAQTGDCIQLFVGMTQAVGKQFWSAHRDGFVLYDQNRTFLLNGESVLQAFPQKGLSQQWWAWKDDIVNVRHFDGRGSAPAHVLNGKTVLHHFNDSRHIGNVHPHPSGLLVVRNLSTGAVSHREFYLNGKHICADTAEVWDCHPEGVVVQKKGKLLLNGKKVLAQKVKAENWFTNEAGVFTLEKGRVLKLNGQPHCQYHNAHNEFLLFGTNVVECLAGTNAVVLNGDRLLWNDCFAQISWHQQGLLIDTNGSLILLVVRPGTAFNPDKIHCG